MWRRPTVSSVGAILKNPAYAGSFVYGRTRTERTGPNHTPAQKPLPITEWRIHIRDVYPPYIDWATYEKIQAMIRDNHSEYDRNKTRGVPRPGKALLHGLVHCGECGHKMVVQYKGGTQYLCNSLRQQSQVPVCQRVPGDPIDDHVVGLALVFGDVLIRVHSNFKLAMHIGSELDFGIKIGHDFDVRVLNNAHPEFQYEVVKTGVAVFSRDEHKRFDYEADVISTYLDLKEMYDFFDREYLARA